MDNINAMHVSTLTSIKFTPLIYCAFKNTVTFLKKNNQIGNSGFGGGVTEMTVVEGDIKLYANV